MDNTTSRNISVLIDDDSFFYFLEYNLVNLPELVTEIASESQAINKLISSYNELKRVLEEYMVIYKNDVKNLRKATRGYGSIDQNAVYWINRQYYLHSDIDLHEPAEYESSTMLDLANGPTTSSTLIDTGENEGGSN